LSFSDFPGFLAFVFFGDLSPIEASWVRSPRSYPLESYVGSRFTRDARARAHSDQGRNSNASSRGAAISARNRSKENGHEAGMPRSSRYQLRQPVTQIVFCVASTRSA